MRPLAIFLTVLLAIAAPAHAGASEPGTASGSSAPSSGPSATAPRLPEAASGHAVAASGWQWPLEGEVITTYRNGDDPYAAGQHRGIDVAGEVGDAVSAATAGSVTFAGAVGSSGLTVSVRTADGRFDTSYLHLSSIDVREGDSVAPGDRLGAVGTTGRRSHERPHLHFGVREAGDRHAYRNPLDFLPAPLFPRGLPDPPQGVPVTAGVPATPSPQPVAAAVPRALPVPRPVPRPAPAPRREPLPRLGLAPAPKRAPAPARGGAHAPHGHAVPRGLESPGRAGAPATDPRRGSERAHEPASREGRRSPAAAPNLGRGPAGQPAAPPALPGSPAGSVVERAPAAGPSSGGLDLGWIVAGLGCVLAVLAARRPNDARRAADRGWSAVGALLRPLLARGDVPERRAALAHEQRE